MKTSLGERLYGSALVVSLLGLALPTISQADDHMLSINGATMAQNAIVTDAGAVTTAMILSNFDGNKTLQLGLSQSLTVATALVKMCKPGTKGNLEWLDQGNTVVGVTGTLTGSDTKVPADNYQLVLTMTGISDTYGSANGPCSVYGQKTYTYTADAEIDKQTGGAGPFNSLLTTTYNFWNVRNPTPEPGTIMLFLAGILTYVWLYRRKPRRAL